MQLTKEIFQKLQTSVDFFKSFSNGELLGLLKLAATEVFDPDEVIFKEGTRGDKMYIILAGTVRISRPIGGGKEEVLVKLGPGACFGEMGIIDQSPRSARATADGDKAVMLTIKESVLSQSNTLIAFKLFRNFATTLAGRLRETNEKLQETAQKDRSSSQQMKDLIKKKVEGGEGVNFQGAALNNADLSGCFLNNANLKEAVLVKARMSETKLKEANFTDANMTSAHFENIEFNEANFSNVMLAAAVFKDCKFNNCHFKAVNLSGADLSSSVADAIKNPPTPSEGAASSAE
ncbi:MAG: pentapeptide repeat-containing protein [bacterium]|nr:pentapeptide repeat-containing protein [bacterium]